ncbi:MAG: glycosyltransferase family 4 protein [Planctomycetota bacterium]
MKILFLTHYFPPDSNAPASRVYEMAKRWVADGNEVTVITGVPNCPDGIVHEGYRNRIHRQVEMVDGIRVIRVWTYIAADEGTIRRILNFASYMLSAVWAGLFLKRHDVLIATSPQFFCGWAGVLLSKIRRIPFVLEIRDIWPESIVAVGAMSNRKVIALLEKLERWMYAAATHIVAVGEGYKRRIVAKGVDPNRITIITNGVDTELFCPRSADEDIRKRHDLDHHFVCAYVGTLGMACGMDVAIRAGRILKERGHTRIRLMLIGEGAMFHELENDVRRHNLDNVILTGKLPRDSIPGYLASVDACLVHLKKTDIFKSVLPSKIFEAAAMERPIVLGVEGDAAELVRDASAGICIEPENAEELVTAVLKLDRDADLRDRYGRSGRQYVVRHFDRNALAGSYLELIRLLLARHSTECAKAPANGAGRLVGECNRRIARLSNTR